MKIVKSSSILHFNIHFCTWMVVGDNSLLYGENMNAVWEQCYDRVLSWLGGENSMLQVYRTHQEFWLLNPFFYQVKNYKFEELLKKKMRSLFLHSLCCLSGGIKLYYEISSTHEISLHIWRILRKANVKWTVVKTSLELLRCWLFIY